VAAPPTSSRATTSLILGLMSLIAFGFLLGVPAMVIGHGARREIQNSQGRLGGEGLAAAGFWTGLVGTVWSLLAFGVAVAVFHLRRRAPVWSRHQLLARRRPVTVP
jgi:hypothetical protein